MEKLSAFLNDVPTSVGTLKKVGEHLVEIHGQFDRLLSPTHHRSVLDEFENLAENLRTVKKAHSLWIQNRQALKDAQENLQKHEENREYLTFCLKELEALNPEPLEEEKLLEKRAFLMNYEKLQTGIQSALHTLQEGGQVENTLNGAYRSLLNANRDGLLDNVLEKLDANIANIQDTIQTLEDKHHECFPDDEDQTLEDIEGRLNALRSMATKHRCTPDELVPLLELFQKNVQTLQNAGTEIALLESNAQKALEAYEKAAKTLSQKRLRGAEKLMQSVHQELKPLKLHAHFLVCLTPLEQSQWSENGMESIEFHVSTNPGETPGPLSKVASGGELSRLMLALKVCLNQQSHVPTLIFDEIDTGLGGAVADAMGKRLKELSAQTQVLSITHPPQMAAYANQHYRVAKHLKEDRMQTNIEPLKSYSQREEELARMLSGATITKEAKAAASQLLKGLNHESL